MEHQLPAVVMPPNLLKARVPHLLPPCSDRPVPIPGPGIQLTSLSNVEVRAGGMRRCSAWPGEALPLPPGLLETSAPFTLWR